MWSACLDHKFDVKLVLLICPTKVQLVGCTFSPPFLLPAILLGASWGVVAELARLVGPRVYVEFPRPRTRIELGGVGGTRAKEHQNPHFLIQGVDWWLPD